MVCYGCATGPASVASVLTSISLQPHPPHPPLLQMESTERQQYEKRAAYRRRKEKKHLISTEGRAQLLITQHNDVRFRKQNKKANRSLQNDKKTVYVMIFLYFIIYN